MRRKKLYITLVCSFIVATILSVFILLNSNKILTNFKIISVDNNMREYTVKYERVKAAVNYRITIYDQNDIKIYDEIFDSNVAKFNLNNLEYDNTYSLMVYAIDKSGETRPAKSEYKFKWDEASIEYDSTILKDEDLYLTIDGDLQNKHYKIECLFNDDVKLSEELTKDEYVVSKSIYQGLSGILKVQIKSGEKIVDEHSFYNNMNPISDVAISSIEDNSILKYNDVYLEFTGGDNSESTEIKIYENKKLIKTSSTSKKKVILSKDLFKTGLNYKIEVIPTVGEYKKNASVNFQMSEKEQLKPVYISNNWNHIKRGTKITLASPDKDATIYYTLDGNNPESFGIPYKEPITINENVTLKAVAVSDNKVNSIIKTYNINVSDMAQLKVYISPSNQSKNFGVKEALYTNERDEMNDLSNYIVERLERFGVKIKRNNSSGNINLWLKESNYFGANLHIAIHSNASVDHTSRGIETWIHSESSDTYSLANKIQKDLVSIYPDKDEAYADRGVKYANGALGEVNDNYLPFGILVEVAHHDYYEDALWIMQNKKLIGYNIADSILKYYQIIE